MTSDIRECDRDASVATVLDQIADRVAERPDSVAVSAADAVLTYAQLWNRALQLRDQLRAAGVTADHLVGLCVPRSPELVVGALGIFAAGAGYVALDPAQPTERLRFMLRDSGTQVLVAEPEVGARCGTGQLVPPPRTDDVDRIRAAAEVLRPSDVAYVVYTSGSTGRPKGALVEHSSLSNLIRWHNTAFVIRSDDRTTLVASPGFDASVWEIWPSLAAGASLHVPPEEFKMDPKRLRDWLLDRGITVTFLPTPLAEAALELDWPERAPLRYLLTGGDRLRRRPRSGLPFTVVNNYGVSEATVVSTSGIVAPAGAEAALPGIGTAIDGVDVLIVDECMDSVPPGTVGELVIRGVSVARGYVGDIELERGRFIPDPGDPNGRAYRTGDLVQIGADGQLKFVGRGDDQVQIRGLRVEPAEISAVLDSHPAVRASTVLIDSDRDDPRLNAFVVTVDGGETSDDDLRTHLARQLPRHMIPPVYTRVAELPISVNGKVDRAALWKLVSDQVDQVSPLAPRNDLEAAIALIVGDRLGLPEVGIDENFFLLGGHSMLGAQLIMRIRSEFGVEMSLRSVFEHPTVIEMAEEVERLLLLEISQMSDNEILHAASRLGDEAEL